MITGVVFLVFGTGLVVWARRLYLRSRQAIEEGRYNPDTVTASVLTTMIVLGGMVLVGLVFWST